MAAFVRCNHCNIVLSFLNNYVYFRVIRSHFFSFPIHLSVKCSQLIKSQSPEKRNYTLCSPRLVLFFRSINFSFVLPLFFSFFFFAALKQWKKNHLLHFVWLKNCRSSGTISKPNVINDNNTSTYSLLLNFQHSCSNDCV